MPKLHRKDDGQPLRAAMARAGLSIPALAEATKRVDPAGKGVSAAAIGRLAGQGKTARSACELKTAWFIAEALHAPLPDLFAIPARLTVSVELKTALRIAEELNAPLQDLFAMPTPSTSNIERSTPDADEG